MNIDIDFYNKNIDNNKLQKFIESIHTVKLLTLSCYNLDKVLLFNISFSFTSGLTNKKSSCIFKVIDKIYTVKDNETIYLKYHRYNSFFIHILDINYQVFFFDKLFKDIEKDYIFELFYKDNENNIISTGYII